MMVFITIILFAIAFAFIAYPYFSRTGVIPVREKAAASGDTKRPEPEKTTETSRDIDSEIENRIQNIRRKKMRFCPQCGAENKEDSRFCAQCGEKLPVRKDEE